MASHTLSARKYYPQASTADLEARVTALETVPVRVLGTGTPIAGQSAVSWKDGVNLVSEDGFTTSSGDGIIVIGGDWAFGMVIIEGVTSAYADTPATGTVDDFDIVLALPSNVIWLTNTGGPDNDDLFFSGWGSGHITSGGTECVTLSALVVSGAQQFRLRGRWKTTPTHPKAAQLRAFFVGRTDGTVVPGETVAFAETRTYTGGAIKSDAVTFLSDQVRMDVKNLTGSEYYWTVDMGTTIDGVSLETNGFLLAGGIRSGTLGDASKFTLSGNFTSGSYTTNQYVTAFVSTLNSSEVWSPAFTNDLGTWTFSALHNWYFVLPTPSNGTFVFLRLLGSVSGITGVRETTVQVPAMWPISTTGGGNAQAVGVFYTNNGSAVDSWAVWQDVDRFTLRIRQQSSSTGAVNYIGAVIYHSEGP